MSTLPAGWVVTSIGSVCELVNGRAFKPSDWTTTGLPIVRIQNLNDCAAKFNRFDGEVRPQFLIDSGQLLFAWSGTPGTSFGAHIWSGGKAVLNQHIFRVEFPEAHIDKAFFRFAINQKLEELIGKAHGGVGLRHVTKGKFEETEIALPPLAEQRRIVAKLDALTARTARARADLDRVPALAERYKQAILAAAMRGDSLVGGSTASAPTIPLRAAINRLRTGPFGSAVHKHDYVIGGVPLINPMHINGGRLSPSAETTVSQAKAEELADFRLSAGDVIIARRGVMGRCAVVDDPFVGCLIGTGSMAVSPSAVLDPRYLQLFLSSPDVVAALEANAVGTTMVNLNQGILLDLELRLPKIDEQRRIVGRVEAAFSEIDRLVAEAAAARRLLDRLDQAILAKAFRGDLVPQDPADEPAEALLARIRADRAAAPAKPRRGRRATA